MTRPLGRLATLLVLLPWLAASAAQPSASRGATLFQERCSVCHTVEPGAGGGQGPNLRGVVGRKAASTDFSDSVALTRWGRTWTRELLGKYLTNPGALVPGTTMEVRVPERRDRADIVAYLASLEAAPASAAPVVAADAGVSASRAASTPPGPPDGGTGGVLTGAAAFGDWRSDAPGVRRLIRVEDLPPAVRHRLGAQQPPGGAAARGCPPPRSGGLAGPSLRRAARAAAADPRRAGG